MVLVVIFLIIIVILCMADANIIICWFKNNRAPVHSMGASVLTKEINENSIMSVWIRRWTDEEIFYRLFCLYSS